MSLEIKNLSKKYTNDYIFRDFSYKFADKGVYLILGKSGVGKTTLMRIITGIDKSFSGEILGGGIQNTSVAFQEYRLFPELSATENVYLEASFDATRARELLISLGFTEDECNATAKNLSGGMKQRVSIARALFRRTPILCLDEPTKEIGRDNVERLNELLQKEAKERLVIIITHTPEDFSGLDYTKISL